MNTDFTTVTKKLTRKQKLLWGGGILVVFLYFNPSFVRPVVSIFSGHASQKPSPRIPQPAAPSADEAAAAAAAAAFAQETTDYAGKWSGSALVKDRGTCKFEVEIGTQQNVAKPFTAYTNMLCMDLKNPAGTNIAPGTVAIFNALRLAPESSILSGALSDKTIAYETDRIVSHGQDKCDMASLDITPFGSGQVAAEWKDNCGGGEMTLVRR